MNRSCVRVEALDLREGRDGVLMPSRPAFSMTWTLVVFMNCMVFMPENTFA